MTSEVTLLQAQLAAWFAHHARDLPWRAPGTSAWGVLVSEIMLQQTPAARVEGPWKAWVERWPTASLQAKAGVDEVLRAWGRLGYPRRALRLHQAAIAITERHGGEVPQDEVSLLALPGVGRYTAAAVMAFAFSRRSLVLDVNIRRVLTRIDQGRAHPPGHESAAERLRAWDFVPATDSAAALWSASAMELGALVCTSRQPHCVSCPVSEHCAWLALGRPDTGGPVRGTQPWEGTDRQCRGRIMAALRDHEGPVPLAEIAWHDDVQARRAAAGLIADGLARETDVGLTLP